MGLFSFGVVPIFVLGIGFDSSFVKFNLKYHIIFSARFLLNK